MMPNMLKLAKNNNLEEPNWMGKIPNILKFAKISQFLGISIFPGSNKNLKIWVQNQGQWPQLSGKNTPYIEIGQN